ncbi:winged helix-turn-helix domain-containing protein [Candidatus Woesearchaeota archaeon]|nr:winged helix-turn-helix domain-containing protein [Candidatus Woesearchaeota archaeon]
MRITRVTIVREKKLSPDTINDLLMLFGESLGLFSMRDKDKSCYRIFITLIKALKMDVELTSDELASQTGLTRGTVIHHLNRLMAAGIVVNYKNKYYIEHKNLKAMVTSLREGMNALLDDLSIVADKIDDRLDL